MKYSEAHELAQGLRELADFVDKYGPQIPGGVQVISGYNFVYDSWNDPADTARMRMRRIAKILAKTGIVEKKYEGSYLELVRRFGPFKLVFNTNRENVCRKVVTGVKHVEERVVEAHDEDIVEWICDDPILRA